MHTLRKTISDYLLWKMQEVMAKIARPARSRFIESLKYVITHIAHTHFLRWIDRWELLKTEKCAPARSPWDFLRTKVEPPFVQRDPITRPNCDGYFWKWQILSEIFAESLWRNSEEVTNHLRAMNLTWEPAIFGTTKKQKLKARQCCAMRKFNLWEIGPVYAYSRHFAILVSWRGER